MALLTARAAADRLGVGYSTMKQWIYKGTIKTVRTNGGHHRIPETEIDRLLGAQGKRSTNRHRTGRNTVLVSLGGRNQLQAVVEEVRVDGMLAQVRLRIGDQRLTAIIPREAVDGLRLKRGQAALAIIKSTEVTIARERQSNDDS